MERKLTRTYNEARTELTKEWQAFMKKQEPKVKDAYEDLQKALQTGDTQTIFDARVYYQRVMMNTTIRNNRYRGMVNNLTSKIADVNKTALNYVNGNMANIYTINYNAFSDEDIKGYSFDLINENAIRELMTTDKMLVPTKKLNVSKDRAWNAKFINSQVTQGIMQGESIDKIAKRILPEIVSKSGSDLIRRNKNSAIRNARTMTTAAENKGRQDSFKKAQSDGVIMTRTWVATHDERTRAWHSDMDGVETAIDEPWENDYGEIMFPGDPAAHPANVYNCRCSIRAHVKGFDWSKSEKESQTKFENTHEVAQGKDISDTWTRRPDEFDFEIEDVINAQGFDGLPRVVSAEEFDRAVNKSNFIAQRTYSAPNQETLNAYREQLYNGKWYVDCSVGESHYGQGMYCTANEGQIINDSIRNTMDKYIERNVDRITDYGDLQIDVKSAVETFTVAPDAKFISHDNLRKLKEKEITELSSNGNYDKMNEIFNMDNGSYATMKGYDGITGVYNFVSKDNDDVIILNRTKVIFKKGE